jgi:hypothetical protein
MGCYVQRKKEGHKEWIQKKRNAEIKNNSI